MDDKDHCEVWMFRTLTRNAPDVLLGSCAIRPSSRARHGVTLVVDVARSGRVATSDYGPNDRVFFREDLIERYTIQP